MPELELLADVLKRILPAEVIEAACIGAQEDGKSPAPDAQAVPWECHGTEPSQQVSSAAHAHEAAPAVPPDAPGLDHPPAAAHALVNLALVRSRLTIRRMRPVSWALQEDRPLPGDWCSCCLGGAWWSEAIQSRGWRCSVCHPPSGLPTDRTLMLRTHPASSGNRSAQSP